MVANVILYIVVAIVHNRRKVAELSIDRRVEPVVISREQLRHTNTYTQYKQYTHKEKEWEEESVVMTLHYRTTTSEKKFWNSNVILFQ